jgi:hypothetical protein
LGIDLIEDGRFQPARRDMFDIFHEMNGKTIIVADSLQSFNRLKSRSSAKCITSLRGAELMKIVHRPQTGQAGGWTTTEGENPLHELSRNHFWRLSPARIPKSRSCREHPSSFVLTFKTMTYKASCDPFCVVSWICRTWDRLTRRSLDQRSWRPCRVRSNPG